ncbi:hypothetical protein KAU19_04145 [Candidatus Parcubacteria bacterium]|nr:hypothetical protein [Candidatus Parcubacteria bacterium]
MEQNQNNQNEQVQAGNEEAKFTLQDVSRKSFSVEDLDNAQIYIGKAVQAANDAGVSPTFNFDTNEELPAGYGLAVIPLTERVAGQGNVTKGLCIAAIPSVDTILQAESGSPWVINQINAILLRSIKSAAMPSDDGSITSIPFKVEDFTTSTRSSALAAFNAVASLYVKALKDKGLKFMSKGLLRQVLSSAAFAEQQFPRIGQDNWQLVISSMVAHTGKEGIEAGILKHWAGTRDEIEVSTVDIDLSDIDGMVE